MKGEAKVLEYLNLQLKNVPCKTPRRATVTRLRMVRV